MRAVVLLSIALALIVAGCGSDDNDTSGASSTPTASSASDGSSSDGGPSAYDSGPSGAKPAASASQTLPISADGGGKLVFDTTKLTANAGKVTIKMTNPGSAGIPHGVGIEGAGVDEEGETVQPGGESVATADLKAGDYEYYCTVASHRQAGMVGKLTVK